MKIKTLDLDARYGSEFAGHYLFRELTWAKRSRIIQKHTRYNPRTGAVENSDLIAIQAETIMASLQSQPAGNPLSLEKIVGEVEGISIELGELFASAVNKLCGLDKADTDFLPSQSDGKCLTPQSQSIDSAKNSGGPQISSANNLQEASANS